MTTDELLRAHGYSIATRKGNDEPTWFPPRKDGVQQPPVLQSEALRRIQA